MMSTSGTSLTGDRKVAHLRHHLATSAWFSSLPEQVQNEILPRLAIRNFAPGDVIYAQGEKPAALYAVISGQTQTVGTADDGQQAFLSVARAGEWSGFIGLLDGRPNPFSMTAVVKSDVAVLSGADVEQIFFRNALRFKMFFAPLASILRFAFGFLIQTNGRPPRRVVAQRLLDLAQSTQVHKTVTRSAIERISQEDIAAATYLTRPTVNKVLREMDEAGLIKIGYGKISLNDKEALRSLARGVAGAAAKAGAQRRVSKRQTEWHPSQGAWNAFAQNVTGEWFARFPASVRADLLAKVTWHRFEAGETIYNQGDDALGLYAIAEGQAKVVGRGTDGQRALISLIHPGEWTSFLPMIDGLPQPFSMIASRPSVVALIARADLEAIVMHDLVSVRLFTAPSTAMLRYVYDYLIETNQRPPLRLVAQRLYDLARCTFHPSTNPRDFVDDVSQDDMALATGLSRPTVNRAIKELAAEGLIKIGYRKIAIIDPGALAAFARSK
jgi:CRP/FNR family transcriptional regulator, cyclic AMP receptor protein